MYLRRGQPLGDDVAELSTPEWQAQMLAAQRAYLTAYRQWQVDDARARKLQIAATLAIPLAAAVWKLILGRRQSSTIL